MRRTYAIGLAFFLLCNTLALAGEKAQPRKILIGVVRLQQIFEEYEGAKDMEGKIKATFEGDVAEIKKQEEALEKKKEELRSKVLLDPQSAAYQLAQLEIRRMSIVLQEKIKSYVRERQKARAEYFRSVYKLFRAQVKRFGEYHDYDLIITAPDPELSEMASDPKTPPEAVQNDILLRRVQFIGGKSIDITPVIVKMMNDAYGREKKAGGDIFGK